MTLYGILMSFTLTVKFILIQTVSSKLDIFNNIAKHENLDLCTFIRRSSILLFIQTETGYL